MPTTSEPGRAPRRFFLARTPDEGAPELEPADREHALRVVRVRPGERLVGLDGRGGAWPLEVVRAGRRELVLRAAGPVERSPAPGAPASSLAAIEIVSAVPRGGRAEDLVDRLTQLGVATWTPWVTERSTPAARDVPDARRERLARRVREACKQCRRSWPLVLGPTTTTAELAERGLGPRLGLLAPGAGTKLADWAERRAASASASDPIVLAVGPEGGLTPSETERLEGAGARSVSLGPHVLRIEAAAETAAAIVAHAAWRPPRPGG